MANSDSWLARLLARIRKPKDLIIESVRSIGFVERAANPEASIAYVKSEGQPQTAHDLAVEILRRFEVVESKTSGERAPVETTANQEYSMANHVQSIETFFEKAVGSIDGRTGHSVGDALLKALEDEYTATMLRAGIHVKEWEASGEVLKWGIGKAAYELMYNERTGNVELAKGLRDIEKQGEWGPDWLEEFRERLSECPLKEF